MVKAAFLFKPGREERLSKVQKVPRDFYYGFFLDSDLIEKSILLESDLLDGVPQRMAVDGILSMLGLQARMVRGFFRSRKLLNHYDVIVSTTNTQATVLGFLVTIRVLKARVVSMVMGIAEKKSNMQWWMHRHFLRKIKPVFISKTEFRMHHRYFPNSVVLPFGVDLDFWFPADAKRKSTYILSIGNDANRDYQTLIEAWDDAFPVLHLVTGKHVDLMGKENIRLSNGDWRSEILSDEDVRELFRNALIVVIPISDTTQPAGQSATLQAMACSKSVIISNFAGLWDRDFLVDGFNCRLYQVGDAQDLKNKVRELLDDPASRCTIGLNARDSVVKADHLKMFEFALCDLILNWAKRG